MTDAEKEWAGLPRGGSRVVIEGTTHIVLDACVLPRREWWTCCGVYMREDPARTDGSTTCVVCLTWEFP